VDAALLFRFSALTYNAHRIHYDRDFTAAEGHPGLLVHGPLQALLMAEHCGWSGAAGYRFAYRLTAPLYDFQGLVVGGTPAALHVRDRTGRRTATATLTALPGG
jgi:3-methylfumaryl-CoA hydratase